MELIFAAANAAVLPFWLLLLVAPTGRLTLRVMGGYVPVLVLAAVYAVVVVPGLPAALPELANPKLEPIRALLGTPEGATGAWLHLLAFDLLAGTLAWRDALARGVPLWPLRACLVLTLMAGPLGFAVYWLGVRRLGRPPVMD